MAFKRPSRRRHIVVAVLGVTLAFAAAAVAGQVLFRDRFGPKAAHAATLALNTVPLPTTDQAKQAVQAGLNDAANMATQAVQAAAQEQWDKAKANTAAKLLEATTAGEHTATAPINDLKSPAARQQAQAVATASVSLWQSLWEVFVSIWHGLVGIFKK